jgi:hypothetical protein
MTDATLAIEVPAYLVIGVTAGLVRRTFMDSDNRWNRVLANTALIASFACCFSWA